MTITYHDAVEQGSEEWLQLRCGVLTASEVKLILTPTLKVANNDKTRQHVWEIAAQRINQYVEPHYIGDDMLRGHEDEVRARLAYDEKYGGVSVCGFITNSAHGGVIGYSPDWLVNDDGQAEAKSRRQKYQVQTILNGVPDEHWLQLQAGLIVTERDWIDYVSYCGGMPMVVIRVEPHAETQEAIIAAAKNFERQVSEAVEQYQFMLNSGRLRWVPTERVIEQEMHL
ncbi:YqaJ-like viral recombinase [Sphingomonas sp. LK11]|uniref:YqaJ viral recombinase family protein n=1 Tax=Sphingomonas sp. LK11 TaxID=1390395 RepID=UPI000972D693|nr:YqaJ viral recombinase family protein [Sphingomonas sp. LK11]APX66296.1 YqaJ-like viral recombinase [Sphingomonas sp. LK11]